MIAAYGGGKGGAVMVAPAKAAPAEVSGPHQVLAEVAGLCGSHWWRCQVRL